MGSGPQSNFAFKVSDAPSAIYLRRRSPRALYSRLSTLNGSSLRSPPEPFDKFRTSPKLSNRSARYGGPGLFQRPYLASGCVT